MNVTNPNTKDAHEPLACRIPEYKNLLVLIMILTSEMLAGYKSCTYQNRSVTSPHIQVDGSNANCDYNVNYKPEPVIPKVS